jgi:creatinine amidohydrolase
LTPSPWIISLQNFRNFDLLTSMLGATADPPTTTHADGAETSLMLFYRPDMVRPGYEQALTSTSTVFRNAARTGNRSDNPSGTGGFPTTKASSDVARRILEFRTTSMGDAVMVVLRARK